MINWEYQWTNLLPFEINLNFNEAVILRNQLYLFDWAKILVKAVMFKVQNRKKNSKKLRHKEQKNIILKFVLLLINSIKIKKNYLQYVKSLPLLYYFGEVENNKNIGCICR